MGSVAYFRPICSAIALALTASSPALSYLIQPRTPIHERMTAAGEACVKTSGANFPRICDLTVTASWLDDGKVPYATSPYASAVRWPDDPTRQLTNAGLLRFVINVGLDGCKYRFREYLYAGILCESHFGRLQFLHAMQSNGADGKPESDELTRKRILAWTGFAFGVATAQTDLTANFCLTVRAVDGLGDALAPESFPYCVNGAGDEDAWQVRSLFSFRCGKVHTSSRCTVLPDDNQDAITRAAAAGALVHLIQDSFSQAHTARGGRFPLGPYSPRVVCGPVEQFYHYDVEQAKVHGNADATPRLSADCGSKSVLDPVTATARMLWMVQHGCHASWAIELIDRGVLGSASAARVPASSENCRRPLPV